MSDFGITCFREDRKPIMADSRRALSFYLEDTVRYYIGSKQLCNFPTPLECKNKYAKIASACENLLNSLSNTSEILDIDVIIGGTSETPHAFIVESISAFYATFSTVYYRGGKFVIVGQLVPRWSGQEPEEREPRRISPEVR
jgi:hypothetical protein